MNQQNAFERIAELEAKLAIATANCEQAVKERDAHYDVEAELDRAIKERDALRAKVAEMRESILGLGEVIGHLYIGTHGERYLTVHFEHSKFGAIESLNAIVAKLRGEQSGEAGR